MLLTRAAPWLIAVLATLVRILPGPRTIDDAYITFRYARNLLAGQGFVYNPGEAVLGTTTPLFTSLLAGLGFVSGGPDAPFPWLALVVSALCDALGCLLLVHLATVLGKRGAGLVAGLLWALAPYSVTFAIGGMETSLFITLMLGTLYLYSIDRPVFGAALASLSLLARPDALLLLAPLGLERLRRLGRRPSWRPLFMEALAFFGPLSAWVTFAAINFGSPLPTSLAAKSAAYHLPPEAGAVRLIQHFATPFHEHLLFGNWWIFAGIIGFGFCYGLGSLTALRRRPSCWPVFAFPMVYALAYAIANPLLFRWYLSPPTPLYFLGIALGVERVADDLGSRIPPWLFLTFAVVATLNAWTWRPDHGPARPAPEMAFIQLELQYQQAADLLADQLQPGEVIAAGDIGVLGYETGAVIRDTVGLIAPQAAGYHPLPEEAYVINYAIPSQLIADWQPEYLVTLEVYIRNTLAVDPLFQQTYQRVALIPSDIYGSRGMAIYRRAAGQ
jgi:hypothetical protein